MYYKVKIIPLNYVFKNTKIRVHYGMLGGETENDIYWVWS